MSIGILSQDVASKIAAGEVVERPASVVKELVDNAIDSGATTVAVEISGAGLDLIRVTDNGCGIPSDQVALAFSRFATSKISSHLDLEGINTLGFRGEALPSISAVSDVTMITNSLDQQHGTRIELHFGKIQEISIVGSNRGTSVVIRHLFQNVPARLQFLKSPSTEISRIRTLMHQFAMAFPEVKFDLEIDERISFVSSGTGDLKKTYSSIYGPKLASAMLEIPVNESHDDGPVYVRGLISPPDVSRSNRDHINLLVNGRPIYSRSLIYAIEEAYQGFLMVRRHPLAVIHIEVPSDRIDVNVHPAKLEVRFKDESLIFSAIQRSIRATLVAESPVPGIYTSNLAAKSIQAQKESVIDISEFVEAPSFLDALGGKLPHADSHSDYLETMPVMKVVGQLHSLYIVTESSYGIYIVDQHAAHERVMYEKIKKEFSKNGPSIQRLLDPLVLEDMEPYDIVLKEHTESLMDYGFEIEYFGDNSYLLRTVPWHLKDIDPHVAFVDVLHQMKGMLGILQMDHNILSTIACHSSIRAGQTLSIQEMDQLIYQLATAGQSGTCPHGRPTMIQVSYQHIEKQFGRR